MLVCLDADHQPAYLLKILRRHVPLRVLTETMQPLKDAKVPVMIVHGDIDEVVPVANTHAWVDVMKELNMEYEYVEQPGITHGPVIQSG